MAYPNFPEKIPVTIAIEGIFIQVEVNLFAMDVRAVIKINIPHFQDLFLFFIFV
jgi:hypothetical protein